MNYMKVGLWRSQPRPCESASVLFLIEQWRDDENGTSISGVDDSPGGATTMSWCSEDLVVWDEAMVWFLCISAENCWDSWEQLKHQASGTCLFICDLGKDRVDSKNPRIWAGILKVCDSVCCRYGRGTGGPQRNFEGSWGPVGKRWRAVQPGGRGKGLQVRNQKVRSWWMRVDEII